jgi:SNF2 family DNA or RNA helicase
LVELVRRKKVVEARMAQVQREREESLVAGRTVQAHSGNKDFLPELALPKWCPVLISAPNSVVTNWVEDFKTWAHFNVAVYQGSENGRDAALASVENGVAEILVCGQSMLQSAKGFDALNSANVQWKIVIVDEFHTFKNETKHLATNLRIMRDKHGCVVLGLTGTLMQNNHKELWNLVDIVAKDFLGPWIQFNEDFAVPIQLSR